jgi:cytidylate kinase
MVIAIDGPAGAGKSTVARLLAASLGYTYLDSGAMYRAVAYALGREDLRLEDEVRLGQALERLLLTFTLADGEMVIHHRGRRLLEELRAPEVTRMASRVSQLAPVRTLLTRWQRGLAGQGDVVVEGRDTTTVVFPEAEVKIFLTADIATRAERRHKEYRDKGLEFDRALIEAQIRARDAADANRAVSPLRAAPDALLLDTTRLDPATVLQQLLAICEEKRSQGTADGER